MFCLRFLPLRLRQGSSNQKSLLSSPCGLGPSLPCEHAELHPSGLVAIHQGGRVLGVSLEKPPSLGPRIWAWGAPGVQFGLQLLYMDQSSPEVFSILKWPDWRGYPLIQPLSILLVPANASSGSLVVGLSPLTFQFCGVWVFLL